MMYEKLLLTLILIIPFFAYSQPTDDLYFFRDNGELVRMNSEQFDFLGVATVWEKFHYTNGKRQLRDEELEIIWGNVSYDDSFSFQYYHLTANDEGGFDFNFNTQDETEAKLEDITFAPDSSDFVKVRKAAEQYSVKIPADHYLMPVPDEKVIEVVKLIGDENYAPALDQVAELLESYPDDLFLNLMRLDLFVELQYQEKLRDGIEEFQNRFEVEENSIEEYAVILYNESLRAMEAVENGTHITSVLGDSDHSSHDFRTLVKAYLLKSSAPIMTSSDYSVLIDSWIGKKMTSDAYTDSSQFVRNMIIYSDFFLISGKSPVASECAHRLMNLAQGLGAPHPEIIPHMFQLATFQRSLQLHERVLLNVSFSSEQIEKEYDRLEGSLSQYKGGIQTSPLCFHPALAKYHDSNYPNDFEKVMTFRSERELVHQQLLLMAVSVRHYFLKHGEWPSEGFGELYKGTEKDPQRPDQGPLQVIKVDHSFTIYSVGPDGIDQQGKELQLGDVDYEVPHDIVITIRKEPEFPFPSEPTTYAAREELIAQFPNGLPMDINSDAPGHSYTITDSEPPLVFSIGYIETEGFWFLEAEEEKENPFVLGKAPNNLPVDGYFTASDEEGNWLKIKPEMHEIEYDPTNGMISEGNLYLRFDE